ncbi:putative aromatic ring-opening dioxygenase [Escherichia coli]|uniref:Putative aromatic ring-opening dioxygenase n=1 Tax=Escherichia coli TaxID=562 RepID=A0A2X3K0U7_ECOLX|nr:putative aromatic ring-opening dioxygenase [Escherichia coli]
MNVLEDNLYTRSWQKLGDDIATPASDCGGFGSLVYRGTGVTAMETPPRFMTLVASRRRCTIRIILLRVRLCWHSIWLSC